jgi:hypothetical protein
MQTKDRGSAGQATPIEIATSVRWVGRSGLSLFNRALVHRTSKIRARYRLQAMCRRTAATRASSNTDQHKPNDALNRHRDFVPWRFPMPVVGARGCRRHSGVREAFSVPDLKVTRAASMERHGFCRIYILDTVVIIRHIGLALVERTQCR